jgi:hypothetical protein
MNDFLARTSAADGWPGKQVAHRQGYPWRGQTSPRSIRNGRRGDRPAAARTWLSSHHRHRRCPNAITQLNVLVARNGKYQLRSKVAIGAGRARKFHGSDERPENSLS